MGSHPNAGLYKFKNIPVGQSHHASAGKTARNKICKSLQTNINRSNILQYSNTNQMAKLYEVWNKYVPYLRPCYSVSRASSPELIEVLRQQRVPLICHNPKEIRRVNDASLTIMECGGKRNVRGSEHIVGSVNQLERLPRTGALVWIHTVVSNDELEQSRQMFEYVWANKHILNGIVFNVSNFSNSVFIPSIYSYKIALDYVFRNMVHPFQKEYGITTPAIMMDGRNVITHTDHLFELHEFALRRCHYLWEKSTERPKIHLLVDALFDKEMK
jgi:hypothetical protein